MAHSSCVKYLVFGVHPHMEASSIPENPERLPGLFFFFFFLSSLIFIFDRGLSILWILIKIYLPPNVTQVQNITAWVCCLQSEMIASIHLLFHLPTQIFAVSSYDFCRIHNCFLIDDLAIISQVAFISLCFWQIMLNGS